MSERFVIEDNIHGSKNTRLNIANEFAGYRFARDQLAHVFRYKFVVEHLIRLASASGRPLRVLDVGCGDIYVVRVLWRVRCKKTAVISKYVGVDIDPRVTRRALETRPPKPVIEILTGDVTTGVLSFYCDDSFDVVICMELFEHVQPGLLPGVLAELHRLGTLFFFSTPNATGGTGSLPKDHIKEWDTDELTDLLTTVGFSVNRRIGTFCNLGRVEAVCRENQDLHRIYAFLSERMDKDLLSLCMARFIGVEAQNVLYLCERSERV